MPAFYLEALTVLLGLGLLMFDAFGPATNKKLVGVAAVIGLSAILVASFFAAGPASAPDIYWAKWSMWQFYELDGTALFFKAFALVCTILVILMAIDYRPMLVKFTSEAGREAGTGEYYALPVLACAGMMWMASARDLVSIFVALELVTITFYVLVAYMRRNVGSLEAGVKYLILGALSTGFLVYGIAWIYGMTGTTNLAEISLRLANTAQPVALIPLLFGIAMVLVALGFKVGAVPMQIWIPDVYQGAPSPTTAFLSVGSKAAGFGVLIRFLEPFLAHEPTRGPVLTILGLLAAITLLFGNLAAIPQTNFKRLLAYSSIAHAGFLLLALATGALGTATSLAAWQVVSFYLATYLLMTLAAFFILNLVRIQRGAEDMAAFNGLGKTNPVLALALTLVMAALAGVPLTAGFVGKFLVFQLAVVAGLWWGVVIAFIGVAAGFYYYLKVVRAMYWNAPDDGQKPIATPPITRVVLGVLCAAIVIFGVLPMPVLRAINWTSAPATQAAVAEPR